jgi:UDP-2-acetamido-2,6-beta-L-arabino-hexul-4-ose reductase
MITIGITGQNGFIGQYLYNSIMIKEDNFKLVDFKKEYFQNETQLDFFVSKCDVIVHLAAMNRHSDQEVIYKTNIQLAENLITSLERTNSKAHVIMSSSLQEEKDNLYGKSKKDGRKLFLNWESNSKGIFSGLIIPNVFGPFGRPNYNSVVATFCHKVANGEKPEIHIDNTLSLIYVGELVQEILNIIKKGLSNKKMIIKATTQVKVSEILTLLNLYKIQYQDHGEIPNLNSTFELNLFNTYRCYMDIKNHFPVKFMQHTDPRGSFVEIIRVGIGGQVSFSTTVPGITRGNHFHTRKIERFAVIKGKALIQLRRIGSDEILDFYMDGNEPAYVDMPIWYTHNIKNIGDEILYTNFWINEAYNPEDADTYFVEV